MRRLFPLVISLLTLFAGLSCFRPADTLSGDTSLVLVVVDTLRSDRLGPWGGDPELTPFINRLAGESVQFRRAVAPSSWTKPSVASLMTGLYPGRHGAVGITRSLERHGGSPVLDPGVETLAETLREAGFTTAAFATNVNISVKHNFDQGFDHFVQPAGGAGELCTRALDWVGGRRPGERFFLYLHILDPHAPYDPPEPFAGRFADPDPPEGGPFSRRGMTCEMEWWSEQYGQWLDGPRREPFRFRYGRFNIAWARRHNPLAGDPEFDHILANIDQFREEVDLRFSGPKDPTLQQRINVLTSLYDGVVASVDQALSNFFAGLQERERLSRSVVIFTSDHGEAFLEHYRWGHRMSVYGEEIDIPLLFRVPDGRGGQLRGEIDSLVSLVDLYPTVLEMFGLPLPGDSDGVSLWPAIRDGHGNLSRKGPVFSELLLDNLEYVTALRGDRKLIRTVDTEGKVRWEQYNISRDSGEREPVRFKGSSAPARQLRARIEAQAAARELRPPGEGGSAGLSQEEIEQLDALGYLDRESP